MKWSLTSGMTALIVSGVALAHHSFAPFEMDKEVTMEGTVTEYRFGNPHTHIVVKSATPSLAGNWDVEGGGANIMRRQGWTKNTFKPGDSIKLVGHPMRDGSKGMSLFYVILPDGTRLYHDIARPKAE